MQLNSVLGTGLFISKGELQSLLRIASIILVEKMHRVAATMNQMEFFLMGSVAKFLAIPLEQYKCKNIARYFRGSRWAVTLRRERDPLKVCLNGFYLEYLLPR